MDRNHQNYNKDRDEKKEEQPPHHTPGAGITNRPDDEELENQQRLPPRGHAKAGD